MLESVAPAKAVADENSEILGLFADCRQLQPNRSAEVRRGSRWRGRGVVRTVARIG